MSVVTRPRVPARAPGDAPGGCEQRFIIHGVEWQAYVTIGSALPDRPMRMTYDRGSLEFMTTSRAHESFKKRLGRLMETLAEECGLAVEPGGNMTFQRADLGRALEPDDCYWIAHERSVRGLREWNPERDPPPDLVTEVEISRSLLDRMSLLAALGVPEVWRFDGTRLHVHLLQPDGTYREAERSPTFPAIPPDELVRFARPDEAVAYLDMIRSFRAWVRQHLSKTNP